ncbi:MAG TPA: glycosyltransferase family 4 protein, partial [Polyangiaceae bacterium]
AGNLYGGVETFLRTLAEARAQYPEMQPEFALCFEGRLADEIRASGATLHMLGRTRLSRPWTVLRAQRRLVSLIRARRPDVVVTHSAWPHLLFAPAVRLARTSLVFYRHDIGDRFDPYNLMAGRFEPDAIIANSHYTREHGHPRFDAPTTVLPYVIRAPEVTLTADARRRLRAELGASDDDVVIFQASRMQAWKGQRLLIDALPRLPKKLRWNCWIAGSAQRESEKAYVEELRAEVRAQGLESHVRFLGQRSDVADLMAAADVFCQPNVAPEPFGIVFVEALAAGLPVVTTAAAGGALEILDDTCAKIAACEANALATALEDATSTPREARQHAARARAQSFIDTSRALRDLAGGLRERGAKRSSTAWAGAW